MKFQEWATKEFGSIIEAFIAIDTDQNIEVSWEEFLNGCTSRGFDETEENIRTLFVGFDMSRHGHLDAFDLLFLEKDPSRRRLFQHQENGVSAQQLRVRQARQERIAMAEFRHTMNKKYGNMVRAWRMIMDPEGRMYCSRHDLLKVCTKIGFKADRKALWRALSAENPVATTIDMLDPAGAEMLANFQLWFQSRYGDHTGFLKACDPKGTRQVHLEHFKVFLKENGMDMTNREYSRLFHFLDLQGKGYVCFFYSMRKFYF